MCVRVSGCVCRYLGVCEYLDVCVSILMCVSIDALCDV